MGLLETRQLLRVFMIEPRFKEGTLGIETPRESACPRIAGTSGYITGPYNNPSIQYYTRLLQFCSPCAGRRGNNGE